MSPELRNWQQAGKLVTVADTGYRLFVRDIGDAAADPQQTALLIHGFPESSFSYHKVAEGLLGQFQRVVLFDLLGFGFSDKPVTGYSYSLIQQADLVLLLWRHLGISGGHLISHDMGTSVLTELVTRQQLGLMPPWFTDGICSATFTNGSMVLKFAKLRLMQKLLLSPVGASVNKFLNYKSFRASVESAHGVDSSKPDALQETDIEDLWTSCLHNNGKRINHLLIRYLLDRKRFELSRWLPALTKFDLPVHFCWGDADQVARVEMVHHLQQHICPQSQLTLMQGVGHFCQLGSPRLWLESISQFYADIV